MKAGTLKDPRVQRRGRFFTFDLTVLPPLGDISGVALAWHTPDTYWEVRVDPDSIYVSWLPEADLVMWPTWPGRRVASVARIGQVHHHHVRVDTKPVRLTVDGTTVVAIDAPAGRPVTDVDLNPRRPVLYPADYPHSPRLPVPELSFPELTTDPGSESGSWDPVDPWPHAPLEVHP
jgi:hypothetical protein